MPTPTPSKRLVVTRSGRVVVPRRDQQFVYSNDQSEGEQPKWTRRKRRRLRNSSCKSSSTNGSRSSPEAVPPLVYLALGDKVVIVWDEPQPNIVLEDDGELKTKMHKFLGLVPSRRKLYNPAVNYDIDPEDNEKKVSLSINHVVNSYPTLSGKPMHLFFSHIHEPIRDDFVANEPIDLSGLPSKKQLAANCDLHKSSVACLEWHPGLYGFVQSLSPAIPLNKCHPLALTYRQTNFTQRKVALAKVLFNMFNHAIFHCGLQVPIVWKGSMKSRWKCQLAIDATGSRTAEIILLGSIATAAELIQHLLHGMCHAAAFVFNRELSHGDNCRRWAYRARMALPEVSTIVNNCFGSFKYTAAPTACPT